VSYGRHNGTDSEVYVIGSISGFLECLGCRISGEPSSNGLCYGFFATKSRGDMLEHLWDHRNQGWKVAQHTMQRLMDEMEEDGDEYGSSTTD
jgi:hypothetical protein